MVVGVGINFVADPVRQPLDSISHFLHPYIGLVSVVLSSALLLFLTTLFTKFDLRSFFKKADSKILLFTISAAIIFNLIVTFKKVFLTGSIVSVPPWKDVVYTGRFLGPFIEEIFFRGFMLKSFYKLSDNFVLSAVVSSVFFSAVHYNPYAPYFNLLLSTFFLGLITCFLMVKYNNLWYCIAFHFTYNFVVWFTQNP